MGRSQRQKGNNAELEVAKIFSGHGIHLLRVPNSGGLVEKGDLKKDPKKESSIDITGTWNIEIKRQETLKIGEWTTQTDSQAKEESKLPLLIYRRSRQPWRVVIHLDDYIQLLKDAEIGKASNGKG